MDWVKKCGTTAKTKMNLALCEELTFTCKRKTANAIFKHSIHKQMILNFGQMSFDFTAPNKATFVHKGVQSLPIASFDDNRQATGAFCVNISGEFLPI